MTSFKAGYGVSDSTFTGIKHTGGSFVPHLTHCVTACVIERLPSEPRALLQSIRHPREQPFRRAPERIRRILDETCRTGFVSAPASAPGR